MSDQGNRQMGRALTEQELRSRRARNRAIGICIGLFVLLIWAVTIVKLGPGVLRPS